MYNQTAAYDVASIRQFLNEAKPPRRNYIIHSSSISLAEIRESHIKLPGIGSLQDLYDDYTGQIIVTDPSPNIMILASRLRDIPYKKEDSTNRVLSLGDSIMLATCLHLSDAFDVTFDVFHTYDDGKKGKTIPLLSYHEWCEGLTGQALTLARRVCALKRERPVHPNPELAFPGNPSPTGGHETE